MRVLFKILLFPVTLLLTFIVAVCRFLVVKCAFLFNIISGILFFGALVFIISYISGWPISGTGTFDHLRTAIILGVFAFLFSPYGLPKIAMWIVDKLDDLNMAIKSL